MSRPSIYTAGIAVAICNEVAAGKSLRAICGADGMPSKATLFRWLKGDAEFCDQYMRAKQAACYALIAEQWDIADGPEGDIERAELMIDAFRDVRSRLKPRKYLPQGASAGTSWKCLEMLLAWRTRPKD